MNQSQQHQVPLQTLNNNAGYRQEPMINLSTPSTPGGNEQQWKHFLTNIPPSVSRKLTFIGIFYIILGLINISLEIFLITHANGFYFGGFVNGLFLFIVGVLTLVLCQQQVYTLTNLYVLAVFQLHILIIVFGLYAYILNTVLDRSITNDSTTTKTISIVDLVHLFITFCMVIVNLVIINNARRLPTIPVTSNYIVYTPQAQAMPVIFHNPHATPVNSIN